MTGRFDPSEGEDHDVDQLRRDGERLMRLLRLPDASTTYEGHDRTRTVHVVLDGVGVVTDVRVARGWQSTVDYRTFGAVVLEAIEAAGQAQSAAFRDHFIENERAMAIPVEEEPAPRRTRRRPAVEPEPAPAAARPDVRPPQVFLTNLVTLIGRADAELRDHSSGGASAPATTGQSPGGHVTVTLNGNRVVDVDLERRWLNVANNMEVASELRGAFAAANAAATAPWPVAAGPLAELNALLANSDELITSLFGTNR